MSIYGWLNNKKYDFSLITIWGLFISFIIQTFYLAMHSIILTQIDINDALKILVYICTGIVSAFLATKLLQYKFIQRILYSTNYKSINEDIFDDIIDYDERTMMNIYIKSSNIYYLGRFIIREEKGLNSWIVLTDYYRINKESNNPLFDPDKGGLNSTVAINLRDVERIELIYEKDSEIWKRLTKQKSERRKEEKHNYPTPKKIAEMFKEISNKTNEETDK